ncbi:MAG: class I SAM-dependent methyltransferase [Methylotetracoccus sp.]|jgi:ubiquinone/menaquinone biosynthesis C-methylase UbiE|nr:class I SAM-dependent methyltransferase [Methylotetracoccus sp.]
MDRIPEPDLMDDPAQAEAYHRADFTEAHEHFVTLFRQLFEAGSWAGPVLDLGCGTADVTRRFARVFDDQPIHGVDGAEAMLRLGREMLEWEGLNCRVELFCRYLPVDQLPEPRYGAVISNSLLHHLQDPLTLWSVIRRFAAPGAPILVMDLLRPATSERAAELVALHAAGEAEILRRDFFNSLCAAYRPHEVEQQIREAGLEGIDVTTVSDRHWIAWGRA